MTDSEQLNPLLKGAGLPLFDQILPQHVGPAVEQALVEARRTFEEMEATFSPTWNSTLGRLEELERPFDYIWKPVSHLVGVKNSPELRTAHEAALPGIIDFSLKVRQSQKLYLALKGIRDGAEWNQLDEAQKRIVADRIKDAELAGIGLPADQQQRFNEIERELSQLGVEFSNHVLDATKAYFLDLDQPGDVAGIPLTARRLAAAAYSKAHPEVMADVDKGPWRFTLEQSSFGPFMEHCRNRSLRETMYRAFVKRASSGEQDNTPLIGKILKLRREKGTMLGFASYANLSLARKMAPSVDAIRQMLEKLRNAAWTFAEKDLRDLTAEKEASGDLTPIALWDVAFWAERLREKRYAFSDEELRPYFPFEKVLAGLFRLAHQLFGITVKLAEPGVTVWHPDVRYYRIFDENQREIAGFYLDPYSRPENKRGGAWMDDCLGLRLISGNRQNPVAHLVCNQTPPTDGQPSLMTFREVETLFHEFGHGLQHMLTRIHYADASGINGVEWDAVELPSQFMENWCYHRPVLLGMTGHYQTGEPLPEALFEKIVAAKNYRSGSMMLRQIQFGLVDLALHHEFDTEASESVFDVQQRIAKPTSVLLPLADDRSLCSFQHIFAGGYAAGYYSYKWAEVLSADAYSAFEEVGLDDEASVAKLGRKFRSTILESGGGRHPMELFKEFRGREPKVEPLLKHSGLTK